jgi:hypothetical protein
MYLDEWRITRYNLSFPHICLKKHNLYLLKFLPCDVLRKSNNMNGKNMNQQKVNNKRETSPRSLRVFNGPFTTRVDITRLRLLNQPNIK